ncbi:kinase-like domain-containing protein [Vararia minispora EC-137]|uniref:Kinase-like domain-containing protein n=1 Tax=Vararia minispora EC-137 TaxID=1314806 RepID=A0ACB8QLL0_9AGAM|nr:kinase-like domain-containing protein [Vararia minispora EC-137]
MVETQDVTQDPEPATNRPPRDCFGALMPFSSRAERFEFSKAKRRYTIGRGTHNDFVLDDLGVSNTHCRIEWNGKEREEGVVTITDSSSNGTWVRGEKLSKVSRMLREGCEVVLPILSHGNRHFIFRSNLLTVVEPYYDLMPDVLGSGAYATVYRAICKRTSEDIAIKSITCEKNLLRSDCEERRRLFREIEIMLDLSHPNIVSLREYFVDEDANKVYLALEYMKGGTLLTRVQESNQGIGEAMAKYFTRQMIDALAYIHGKDIAHRDLKPENMLLTLDDPPILKVADFGVSKRKQLETIVGTPEYLAPEITRRPHDMPYGKVVDSFSVGVIVFAMLTNCAAFFEAEADRRLSIQERIEKRQSCLPFLDTKQLTPECKDFVKRLLDENPETRMTMCEARVHAWLAEPVDTYPSPPSPVAAPETLLPPEGVSVDIADVTEPAPATVLATSHPRDFSVHVADCADASQMSIIEQGEPLQHARNYNRPIDTSMVSTRSGAGAPVLTPMPVSQSKRKRSPSTEREDESEVGEGRCLKKVRPLRDRSAGGVTEAAADIFEERRSVEGRLGKSSCQRSDPQPYPKVVSKDHLTRGQDVSSKVSESEKVRP